MRVELYCKNCDCRFTQAADKHNGNILEQLQEEGPWFALGDGETPEDRIFSAVKEELRCPTCGAAGGLSEESLGSLSLQLLNQW